MLLKGAIHHGLYTLLLPVNLLEKEPLISSFAPLLFSPISSLALVFTLSHRSCTQFFFISSSPLLKSTVFSSFLSSVLYFSFCNFLSFPLISFPSASPSHFLTPIAAPFLFSHLLNHLVFFPCPVSSFQVSSNFLLPFSVLVLSSPFLPSLLVSLPPISSPLVTSPYLCLVSSSLLSSTIPLSNLFPLLTFPQLFLPLPYTSFLSFYLPYFSFLNLSFYIPYCFLSPHSLSSPFLTSCFLSSPFITS